jgi:glucokinase
VIFGGGVSNAGEYLIQRVQAAYDRQLLWSNDKELQFTLATLGNNAGIIGAVQALIQESI